MTAYEANDARVSAQGVCPWAPGPDRPRLMITEQPIGSPVAVTTGEPTIVFPSQLISQLDDDEIEGGLAHEVAHFRLRRPAYCSSENVRAFSVLNPMTSLMAAHLRREEEKACDDIAVAAVGRPAVYARMLLKSYRFARRRTAPAMLRLQELPHLVGWKPLVSERIERLVARPSPQRLLGWQYAATVAVWSAIVGTFFT